MYSVGEKMDDLVLVNGLPNTACAQRIQPFSGTRTEERKQVYGGSFTDLAPKSGG